MITFRTGSGKTLHILIGEVYEKIEGVSSLELPTSSSTVKQVDILSSDVPRIVVGEQRLPSIRISVYFDHTNTVHRLLQRLIMENTEVSIRIDEDAIPLFTIKGIFSEAPISSNIDTADKTTLMFYATEKPVWT